MAKGDWWFKFEYAKWDDRELKKCAFETQGFWLRVYIHFRQTDTFEITASVADLARMFGGSTDEVQRSIADLKRTNAATVTLCNASYENVTDIVTLLSRERKAAITIREQTRLRVEKHRKDKERNAPVQRQSKSKSKEFKEREEKEVRSVPAKRGCRLPTDFTATDQMFAWAKANTPDVAITIETEKFKDHWSSAVKNAVKIDWVAAWRLWMRNAQDWNPRGRKAGTNGLSPEPLDERAFKKMLESQGQNGG